MNKIRTVIFSLLFFIPSLAFSLTLSNIETQVRLHVHDTATSSTLQRYSNTVIDSLANEAQRDIVNQTWCIQSSTGYALVAGTSYYALPANFIVPLNVIFTDRSRNVYKLTPVLPRSNFQNNPNYEKQGGGVAPTNYMIRYSTKGVATQEICYFPIPTAASTGTVRMDYAVLPTDLSSSSDVPLNSLSYLYSYHDMIVYYVVSRLKMMEGDGSSAANYFTLYQNGLSVMKDKYGQNPDYLPGAGVGR